MSWNTENTASAIPATSPSLPVMGAGKKAATITRTRMRLMRIVAKNWNAFAAMTGDKVRVRGWSGRERREKVRYKIEGLETQSSNAIFYPHRA